MYSIKLLNKNAVILLILGVITALVSVFEIINVWIGLDFGIVKQYLQTPRSYKHSDKIIFTLFQLCNVLLVIPAIWFYKISKIVLAQRYFESIVVNKCRQIGNFLFLLSAITIVVPRFFEYDKTITEFLWYGVHPFFVMILASLFLSFSVVLDEARRQKEENELTI